MLLPERGGFQPVRCKNQPDLAWRTSGFPALSLGSVFTLRLLIGSFSFLRLLWLASPDTNVLTKVITIDQSHPTEISQGVNQKLKRKRENAAKHAKTLRKLSTSFPGSLIARETPRTRLESYTKTFLTCDAFALLLIGWHKCKQAPTASVHWYIVIFDEIKLLSFHFRW